MLRLHIVVKAESRGVKDLVTCKTNFHLRHTRSSEWGALGARQVVGIHMHRLQKQDLQGSLFGILVLGTSSAVQFRADL